MSPYIINIMIPGSEILGQRACMPIFNTFCQVTAREGVATACPPTISMHILFPAQEADATRST